MPESFLQRKCPEPTKPKKFCDTPIPEKKEKKKKTEVAWKWAINGPCGKLNIINTEDDQVDLTPGDISGAGFSEEKIEKLTVAQLKLVKMPPYK